MVHHPLAWGQTCMLKVSPRGTDATSLHDHPPGEQPAKEQKTSKQFNKQERKEKIPQNKQLRQLINPKCSSTDNIHYTVFRA